jgi:hypothetical protein
VLLQGQLLLLLPMAWVRPCLQLPPAMLLLLLMTLAPWRSAGPPQLLQLMAGLLLLPHAHSHPVVPLAQLLPAALLLLLLLGLRWLRDAVHGPHWVLALGQSPAVALLTPCLGVLE